MTAAAVAAKCNSVRGLADKQLSSLYHQITPLKESSYHQLFKQLKRASLAYGWPIHIMADVGDTQDLTDTERASLDEEDPTDLETLLHIRTAANYKTGRGQCKNGTRREMFPVAVSDVVSAF